MSQTRFEGIVRSPNPTFFPSRYGGYCSVCGEKIKSGELIGYPHNKRKVAHKQCVLDTQPPPEPVSGKPLTFEQGWFRWTGTREQKDIPKQAGFLWAGGDYAKSKGCPFGPESWATKFKDAAYKLREYADVKALKELEEYGGEIEESGAGSFDEFNEDLTGFTCPSRPGMKYWDVQLVGIHYALKRDQTLIADEMGVGKTAESLGFLQCANAKQVIVICPTSVTLNWVREAERWLADRDSWVIWRNAKPSEVPPKADKLLAVVGYGAISAPTGASLRKALTSRDWDVAIIDEAHNIKNTDSIRGKTILGKWSSDESKRAWGVVEKATKVLYLTGTPIPNRPLDIFPILNRMSWEFRGKDAWQKFAMRYNMSFQGRWGWVHPTARAVQAGEYAPAITWEKWKARLNELEQRMRAIGMVRRLKEQVSEIPTLSRQIVPIPVEQLGSGGQSAVRELEKLFPEAAGMSTDPSKYNAVMQAIEGQSAPFTKASKLREKVGLAKVKPAVQYIKDMLEEHEQIVIFTWHHSVREALIDKLTSGTTPALQKNEYVVHYGGMDAPAKQKSVDAFNAGFPVRVFFGQIRSAGEGINLHEAGCHNVLFVEVSWNAFHLTQAEARVHRGDQKNKVLSQTLVIDDSFDAYVAQSMSAKMEVAHEALDSDRGPSIKELQAKAESPEAKEAQEKYQRELAEWRERQEKLETEREAKREQRIASGKVTRALGTRDIEAMAEKAELTDEQIRIVGETISELAWRDPDKARELNDRGFSKADVALGHALAALYRMGQMTSREGFLGAYIGFKYWRQIGVETANVMREIVGVKPMKTTESHKEVLSPGISRLVKDAKAQGMEITVEDNGRVLVRNQKGVALQIWPDGTATRADVHAELASTIRTQKEMRKALGLDKKREIVGVKPTEEKGSKDEPESGRWKPTPTPETDKLVKTIDEILKPIMEPAPDEEAEIEAAIYADLEAEWEATVLAELEK